MADFEVYISTDSSFTLAGKCDNPAHIGLIAANLRAHLPKTSKVLIYRDGKLLLHDDDIVKNLHPDKWCVK